MNARVIREDCERLVGDLAAYADRLAGSAVLVTGGGGFLCSYLLDFLAAFNEAHPDRACRVTAVDNFKSGLPERIAHLRDRADFRFLEADLTQPFAIAEPQDWLVHGAGIASPPAYRRWPLETIDVAVVGTRSLLEHARQHGARGMLLLSSSEIYGDPDPASIPTPEDYRGYVSCTGPRACYDESKRLAETLAATYHRLYDTPVVTMRPFNVYGPGQRIDDGRIIPDLMRATLEGKPLVLHSDGRATRAFCYVADAIRGLLTVLFDGQRGEAYNVGNDEAEMPIGRVAELMSEIGGQPVEYRASADPLYLTDNPQRRCPDLAKLRGLGYVPHVSLREGLARTLESYRAAATV